MPSVSNISFVEHSELIVWEMTEDLEWFEAQTILTPIEKTQLSNIKGFRQKEYAAQRFLAQMLFCDFVPVIEKSSNGKPFVANDPNFISLSHTGLFITMSKAPKDHGIDLEKLDARILRLTQKYCDPIEMMVPLDIDPILWFTLIWSCKESMYKAYGLGDLPFIDHIQVRFDASAIHTGKGNGLVQIGAVIIYYELYFTRIENNLLTFAYPKQLLCA